ncbi:GAF domain-containing protein [Nocardia transvalensis]|uniref:GAF domain-containing protein n=1 Tax=Nocardia transvalensis TaxID=37333 RepID=UPI001895083E|nr:GAF domain-containing protein [Nocardia transvalensis]MBF6331112.1 hypothetical protein [Nocardia transvalensis]
MTGRITRTIAIPVLGPSGHVHAVTAWAGAPDDQPPSPQLVGAIEWDFATTVTVSPAAQFLVRTSHNDFSAENTLPELLACFDNWDNRAEFLALFNLDHPASHWIGTATRIFADGTHHQLYIAARACGTGNARTVRAIVCDITGTQTPAIPGLCSIAVRHMPIRSGRALALVDLQAGVIHEWLANHHDGIAGWRHHKPLIHPDDHLNIVNTILDLLAGKRLTATTRAADTLRRRRRLDPAPRSMDSNQRRQAAPSAHRCHPCPAHPSVGDRHLPTVSKPLPPQLAQGRA